MLELRGIEAEEELLAGWLARVRRASARLGWHCPEPAAVARVHTGGASLALAAPVDQLFAATEVNEWALCATLHERDPSRWAGLQDALMAAALDAASDPDRVIPPVLEEITAFARFLQLADNEGRPELRALLDAAEARDLPWAVDDSLLTLGSGVGGRSYVLGELPFVADVPWSELHDVPTALVTGSNGKTTTVRLLAACTRARGWRTAFNCTDGVFLDDETLASGDYSGPAGARRVIRAPRADAAILETARGGILRRGIAVSRADVAVVTNVSSDHFGEYGIHDLGSLADVKLSVASVLGPRGRLVLNGDDLLLCEKAAGLERRLGRRVATGWFALDADAELLRRHRERGDPTCGMRQGCLTLQTGGVDHDLGPVAAMPLTVGGSATYNISNLAGTAVAAAALGVPAPTIAAVFRVFGSSASDNVGRLMRFDVRGVRVLVDYAHNPEGLRGLLSVAEHLRGGGRLGLLLGHAGNRQDDDIEDVARVAAEFHPDLVVVKENEAHLRGRQPGEVPAIIRGALLRAGLPESALPVRMSEVDAARCALEWARPGDVLALLLHSPAARATVVTLLREG